MRTTKLSFIILLLVTTCLKAQPTIQWEKSLGGHNDDIANSIQKTSDGGYIVLGYTFSFDGDVTNYHGEEDYWLVKLDNSGTIQWQKSLGGTGYDYGYSVKQTSDGGYIVAGESMSNDGDITGNHGSADYWIVKLDGSGTIQWEKSFGGSGGDNGYSIQQTSDGGYIIAGSSDSNDGDVTGNRGGDDFWIVKLNSSGNIEWEKSLGGTKDEVAHSIQQTSDGGYIVAGSTNSNDKDVTGFHGYYDFWIAKLNSSGKIQWQRCLGGTGDDEAMSVQQTSDGGYIVAGDSGSGNTGDVTGSHGGYDYWVVKLNHSGTIQWEKSLGGTGYDFASSVQQISDGGYIVAGESQSNDGDATGNHGGVDYWIVNLDNSGNIRWQKNYGGSGGDAANSIQQTSDGGYIIAGNSNSTDGDVTGLHSIGFSDYWVVKLNPAVLPVSFLNFDGFIQNNVAVLKWATADETNNKGFEVQKSLNDQNFTTIAFVAGQGNLSQINNYSFSDAKLLSGSNYYRLKQIDKDGKFNYSSVIKLDFSKFDWSVLGNPSNNMWVQLQLDKTANISVQVISLNGKILQTINKGNISVGAYSIPLSLSRAASGIYVIQLLVDDKTYSKKIMK